MTLRLKLMAGLMALCALGLAAAGTASVVAVRSYLYDQVDRQLTRGDLTGSLRLSALVTRTNTLQRARLERVAGPTDYLVEIRRSDGRELRVVGAASPVPPNTWLLDAAAKAGGGGGGVDRWAVDSGMSPAFTVAADDESYRAVQRTLPDGARMLVALPLEPLTDTVNRLIRAELAVFSAVGLVVAALSWVWLSRGLRPLRQMIGTAGAIAAGDLDRRVPPGPPRSETGQLAGALNAMLGQIQAAFGARVASQEQERRFAADAAHELRTPLTSIRGYADLLRADMVPPDEADAALRRVQEEATRMGILVDNLLYLAHLDEQRPLQRAPLDLAVLVRDAVADLRAAAPDRPVRADLPPTCPVLGDADALRQLVGNLLTNARVHTPPDTAIDVTLRTCEGTVLDVVDHGPGLPPAVADHVFDRFYRAPDSRAAGRGGSGLGLSIVAATARAHGGQVKVISTPGAGTTFRFLLPTFPSWQPAGTHVPL